MKVTKIDNYKFSHPKGFQIGSGYGIQNEDGEFLTFDKSAYPFPYVLRKKSVMQEVADTIIIDDSINWVKPA